jgi:hypothetical protein
MLELTYTPLPDTDKTEIVIVRQMGVCSDFTPWIDKTKMSSGIYDNGAVAFASINSPTWQTRECTLLGEKNITICVNGKGHSKNPKIIVNNCWIEKIKETVNKYNNDYLCWKLDSL